MTQQALSRQNGGFMKIILIGANGKIGELVQKAMAGAGHEIVKVGRKSGDFQVDIESRESIRQLYQAVGSFDAMAIAAGEVVFAPLSQLTAENWQFSLGSKLMGQISLVQEAIPVHQRKGILHLGFGRSQRRTDLRQRRGCSRLGRAGRFCSGCRRRTSQGITDQCGESDDPEGIRSSIWSVLSRRNSGRRLESGTGLQTRDFGGANRSRLQSRLSLPNVYSKTVR